MNDPCQSTEPLDSESAKDSERVTGSKRVRGLKRARDSERAKDSEQPGASEKPKERPAFFSPSNWHGVSFDLDHTLAKYRLKELYRLCYDLVVAHLCRHGYKRNQFRCFGDIDLRFAQRGIFFDMQHGVMLKLDGDGEIVQAYYGTRRLAIEEVRKKYAGSAQVSALKHAPHIREEGSQRFKYDLYCFDDYYMVATIYLMMELVQMVIDSSVGNEGFEKPFRDIGAAYKTMFDIRNFKKDEGGFYPALKADPSLYIRPVSPEFLQWLKTMRRAQIAVLVFADGPADFAYFLLEHAIGRNWRDYFDAVVVNAKKPYFFTFHRRPFYGIEELRETKPLGPDDFGPPHLYAQGSFHDLKYVLKASNGMLSHNILHIGDNFTRDIYGAYRSQCCDVVGIVEELAEEQPSEWGPLLQINGKPSFWCKRFREQAVGIFSSVEDFIIIKPFNKVFASTLRVHIFMHGGTRR